MVLTGNTHTGQDTKKDITTAAGCKHAEFASLCVLLLDYRVRASARAC